MSENHPRQPYVAPRLMIVQTRVDGDQLATGCKSIAGGPGGDSCEIQSEPCHFSGS